MTTTGSDEAVRDNALEQLTWHWQLQVRPGLDGLSDDEYRWEPVDGCWSVRPRDEATAPVVGGSGPYVVEFAFPAPDPAPVTTIAWRLAHLIVGVFGMRNASHFGGPAMDYNTHDYAGTAADALEQLDTVYAQWTAGVASMNPGRLWEPVGEAEGPYAEYPYLALILHINREAIHHSAEILLLRDLYRHPQEGRSA